jgi:Uncharacterized conserved small protein
MDDKQKEIAKKALQEAKDRKKLEIKKIRPKELKGPKGPEPTRYGDWEKKGIEGIFKKFMPPCHQPIRYIFI